MTECFVGRDHELDVVEECMALRRTSVAVADGVKIVLLGEVTTI